MYADAVPQGVNATDAPKPAALKMGDRLLCDLHVTVCKLSHDRAGVWLNFFPRVLVPAISSCPGGHDGPVLPQLEGDGSAVPQTLEVLKFYSRFDLYNIYYL